jgi:hypothetical protein
MRTGQAEVRMFRLAKCYTALFKKYRNNALREEDQRLCRLANVHKTAHSDFTGSVAQ